MIALNLSSPAFFSFASIRFRNPASQPEQRCVVATLQLVKRDGLNEEMERKGGAQLWLARNPVSSHVYISFMPFLFLFFLFLFLR